MMVVYPAFFIADFLSQLLPNLFPSLKIAFITNDKVTKTLTLSEQMSSMEIVVGIKIIFFLIFWVLLVRQPILEIASPDNEEKIGNMFLHFILSLGFGLLFIAAILVLLSGYSVFGYDPAVHILKDLITDSFLAHIFVNFAGIFFAFPAVVLILGSFLHTNVEEEDA